MKTRLISAAVGLVLLAVVFVFLDTLVLNVTICAICVLGVHELLNATGCVKFRGLTVLSVLMSVVIPFARSTYMRNFLFEAVYLLVLFFFILLLKNNATMRIEHFAMAFLFCTVVPVFFSCAVYIRDDYGVERGGFYLLLALGSAWLCDSCAYFVGRAIGKHKLAPRVSPKKTVEGAVGGAVLCTVLMLLIAVGYEAMMQSTGRAVNVNYLALGLCTPVFAVVGMLGDLSASVIKRTFNVKDYGHIMPGHGGVLDRFDSVLFTLPAVYIVVNHIGLVT